MNAWEFVDALLAEAEEANQACSFSPSQVTMLRRMIAEVPASEGTGRNRQRFAHNLQLSKTRAIKMPTEVMDQIEVRAASLNISFNMMLTYVCAQYLEEVSYIDFKDDFHQNGGVAKWQTQ